MASKDFIIKILNQAGIAIGGSEPFDIQVNDDRLYRHLWSKGSLAAGEGYMNEWWDCEQLDEFFNRICQLKLDRAFNKQWMILCSTLANCFFNLQTRIRSLKVAETHYDLGNELYEAMLGPTMAYTCAYWKDAANLDQAQINKFDLICRKLSLQRGERVLDLGCGWGTLARYAAEKYGVSVVAVNISKEQVQYAKEITKGLPVDVYACDYRDDKVYNPQRIPFDKIMSVGLCEHVGLKNYTGFIRLARKNLKKSGLFLLHTIGRNDTSYHVDPWISKYVFPNSILPSLQLLTTAFEKQFVLEDLHNIGADYDKTLMGWQSNFNRHWEQFKGQYDRKFYRLWNYYLLSCAGGFRARSMQLWQMVLSPEGVAGGYRTIR